MSSDHKILEKIDLYTKGQMNPEERKEFETELEADPQLYRQMELSMVVDQMVIAKETLKLREQMKKDLNKPKSQLGGYLGLGLLTLVAGGALFYYVSKPTDSPNIAAVQQTNIKDTSTVKESAKIQTEDFKAPVNAKPSATNHSNTKILTENTSVEKPAHVQVPEQKDVTVNNKLTTAPVRVETPVVKDEAQIAPKPVTDLCATLQPRVEYSATPSCKGDRTGELRIDVASVKGGTAPYHFVLGGNESSSAHFEYLPSGYFELWIKDAQDCQVLGPKVYIPEKNCKVSQQYIFNPDHDHAWEIPYDKDKRPTRIVIQDKSGRVFYESMVSDFHPSEWRAESSTGQTLVMGLYFFSIEYADGTLQEGSIMITK